MYGANPAPVSAVPSEVVYQVFAARRENGAGEQWLSQPELRAAADRSHGTVVKS
ncbi:MULTISPECIES: hypothetical protein [Streptomyces]|uniref:Uncharacterized protein n=1 Tax=Streptomyces spinosisporus TaxID=2927582 RepID=A0ABS9XH69_9ACTN|nr:MULTISPECIES: hypothetical protein [Streptomyces]MCI3241423.1 hypothetical protein [Streptomyces spinosisporus]WUB41794.1 hypothetical protein OHN38_18570 [Streptomyces sp. NBC_00588]